MQKHNVKVGTTYIVKVSGRLAKVRIAGEHDRGGWIGTNLATGREIRIRSAARLRSEVAQLTTQIGSREARLSNAKYLERAPADVVAGDRAILDEMKSKRDQLTERVRSLCDG